MKKNLELVIKILKPGNIVSLISDAEHRNI